MKLYITEQGAASANTVALDDMILTKNVPTSAGSKMLDGYQGLFDADIIGRLEAAGYTIGGKVNVGEFSIDLLGETSYYGACTNDQGDLTAAVAEVAKSDGVKAVISLDVNGMPRRAAALAGTVFVKPTYGTVSRYGTIPVACSGETVGVMAKSTADCRQVLGHLVGHDDKDGTSLSDAECAQVKTAAAPIRKVAVLQSMVDAADDATKQRINSVCDTLKAKGVEITAVDDAIYKAASPAWNALMCAELCNNVSRYDGIKFGYRTPNYTNIDELYVNSRTEAFGLLLKTAILYGSDVLSTENYMRVYDKALRIRRVICDAFAALFAQYDAVLLPACSKTAYKSDAVGTYTIMDEALFTAPASISGLPVVVAGGVQLMGKAFSEDSLLTAAAMYE
ncbi:MAG: amidase family protein [Oscillospiraceae bacterium]